MLTDFKLVGTTNTVESLSGGNHFILILLGEKGVFRNQRNRVYSFLSKRVLFSVRVKGIIHCYGKWALFSVGGIGAIHFYGKRVLFNIREKDILCEMGINHYQ